MSEMKKIQRILLLVLLLTTSIFGYVHASPDGALTVRYQATGRYDLAAGGVGLRTVDSGDIVLDVPGNVIKGYLYWAGFDAEISGGDNSISVSIDGSPDTSVTADWTYGPDPWIDANFYHFVYVADISSIILQGSHTYTISVFTMDREYGAGMMVVYEDSNLPVSLVGIYDGLDSLHFGFPDPQGPDSEVTSIDFLDAAYDRAFDVTLLVGGVEHGERPNAVWYQAGSGIKPSNLVDESSSIELDGPPLPYPLGAYDNSEWDTYTATVDVPAGSEWACVQIESVDTFPQYGSHNEGKGCSALFIASGFVLKTPPGTGTPGYWKNHPDAWPVDEISIGGVVYPKEEAISIMKTSGKGDKTHTMFGALIAAKLNVLMGNPSGCVADSISNADAWMALYGPVRSGVKAKSEAWQQSGESLYETLDDYNNGLLCAPPRD